MVKPVALVLELIVGTAQLGDGLLCEKLLQGPLLDRLLLVLLKLGDVADRVLKDGSLVLLATGNNLGKFVDTLIDRLTATALD